MKTQSNKPEVESSELLCFEVSAMGIDSYVWAESRGKAIAATNRAANDAGYATKFIDFKCRRKPTLDYFDLLNNKIRRNTPYSPEKIFA